MCMICLETRDGLMVVYEPGNLVDVSLNLFILGLFLSTLVSDQEP